MMKDILNHVNAATEVLKDSLTVSTLLRAAVRLVEAEDLLSPARKSALLFEGFGPSSNAGAAADCLV